MTIAVPRDVITIGQIEVRYLREGSDTNGTLALFDVAVPAGARVPAPHRHLTYDGLQAV